MEDFERQRESRLAALRCALLSGEYRPGPYRFFEIREPKRRQIAAAPYEDRVVHHALCRQLAPVLEARFIPRSFSCQRGKGTTAARECARKLVNRHPYVLKCDISKFFPTIDHAILREKLFEWIRCPGARELVAHILESYTTDPALPHWIFPGDDWVEARERPRGLPIGNLTSQLWGNFYLDEMDHWIVEEAGFPAYVRYTDDFLIFSDRKQALWALRDAIAERLATMRLRFAVPKTRVLSTKEGVPFCGFRFFPDQRPRVLGATKRRFERRRAYFLRRGDIPRLSVAVRSWYPFVEEGNSLGLRLAYSRGSQKKTAKRLNQSGVSGDRLGGALEWVGELKVDS